MTPMPRPRETAPTPTGHRALRRFPDRFRGRGAPAGVLTRLSIALTVTAALACFAAAGPGAREAAAQSGACPNEQFRQGKASHLPDCRAYERVSPANKGGQDITNNESEPAAGGPVTASGGKVAFNSPGSFADTGWGGIQRLSYLARRTGNGWETSSLKPDPPEDPGVPYAPNALADDLERSILSVGSAITARGG